MIISHDLLQVIDTLKWRIDTLVKSMWNIRLRYNQYVHDAAGF